MISILMLCLFVTLPGVISSASAKTTGYKPYWQTPTSSAAQKNWSYAAVYFRQAKDLAKGLHPATWDAKSKVWRATVPGKGTLTLTSTQQSMREGDALFSARIWTADRDYACVIVESRLQATVTVGARIVRINAGTPPTQQRLVTRFVRPDMIKNGNGNGKGDLRMNVIIHNVYKGDRICFLLTNSGDGKGGYVLQTWNLKLLGLPPLPSASPNHS